MLPIQASSTRTWETRPTLIGHGDIHRLTDLVCLLLRRGNDAASIVQRHNVSASSGPSPLQGVMRIDHELLRATRV